MKRSRFSENQIFAILKDTEAGAAVKEMCRRHGGSGEIAGGLQLLRKSAEFGGVLQEC